MNVKNGIRKTLKILASAAALLLAAVIIVVLLLLLRPVRERILDIAVSKAGQALPGELAVSETHWPSLGTLEIYGVTWTDGADTLAEAGRLVVSIDISELFSKDIHVNEVVLHGIGADILAITDIFASSADSAGTADDSGDKDKSEGGFPRTGSLPGIPSIAVDRIEIEGRRILAAEGVELIGLRLFGELDLLSGSEPFVALEELSLDRSSTPVSVDSLWLKADLAAPSLHGEGVILLPHDMSIRLICDTEPDSSFTLRIVPADGPLPPTDAFVSVGGILAVEDRRIRSVDLEIEFLTPGTEELVTFPFLAGSLEGIGPLEGARGSITGHLALSPFFSVSADMHLNRTSYIDTLHLAGAYEDKKIEVEELLLAMPGLSLSASGSLIDGVPGLSAQVRADSMTWLTRIIPGAALPAGTSARLTLEMGDSGGAGGIPVLLEGHVTAGGTSIDSINVSGFIPAESGDPYTADLLVETFGIRIVTSVAADLSSGVDVTLSRTAGTGTDSVTVYLAGNVRMDGGTGDIAIRDLHTEGMFGRISVSADIDSSRSGSFDILGEWPAPPAPLKTILRADSSSWDSMMVLWRTDGPFSLRIGGTFAQEGREISASGSALLPGPRLLAPLTAAGDAFRDLGSLMIDFSANVAPEDSGSSIVGRLDLGRTEWIDTALVSIESGSGGLTVDTALVVFEGLRISVEGGITGDMIDLVAAVSLADSLLVQRLGRLAGRSVSMALDADCIVAGTKDDPAVSIGIDGRLSTVDLVIPQFSGTAERNDGITNADLFMPEGLHANAVVFDSVRASYTDSVNTGESAGAAVRLEADGSDTNILLAFRVPQGDGFSVMADTFFIALSGQTLASTGPFTISTLAGGGVIVDGLSLEGSIGSIKANGIASPDSADLEAHIEIAVPEKPEMIKVAERLWPDSVTIDIRAEGPSRVAADGMISGITIGDGTKTVIGFTMSSDTLALQASLNIKGPEKTILSLEGSLPPLQEDGSLTDGPLLIDLALDRVPVPGDVNSFISDNPRQIGSLSGRIAVRGTLSDPEAVVLLDCSFIGGEELEKYLLSIDGTYARETVSDTALTRLMSARKGKGAQAAASTRSSGLSAGLLLTKSKQDVFTGVFEYPLNVTLAPFTFDHPESGEMLIEVKSEELALTDLDPLLPPDINLEGIVEIEFKAAGNVRNPGFDGRLETKGMSIAVANNLQASPTVALDFGGNLVRPSVKGNIVIERALLRLPEMKESLHAVDGDAILWKAADSFHVASDTTSAGIAETDTSETGEPKALEGMDIDVTISIPNSFRIESERLNIELEGNLRIRHQGDRPIITGELKPTKGRLSFMGRYFEIQRGSVFFYGGDEMNPSFDLSLKARVTDVDIFIKLTGTALEPEVELTSNPSRSESDIMSLLLFGRSMNDLDGSQSNLLQQRTAEILMVFGASKLEGEMSRRLGVDMFTFQQSTRDPNQTALTVGKYISNKTMLKYEQGLENSANFLINLEYQLTRRFKLETFIDQNQETGLEINWSKEY